MKCLLFLVATCICVFAVEPLEGQTGGKDEPGLEEEKVYRLNKSITVRPVQDPNEKHKAFKGCRFVVKYFNDSENYYVIQFVARNWFALKECTVTTHDEYRLPVSIDDVPVDRSVRPSVAGPSSGPLVVPFKFRFDSDSITGEAALGYYAGVNIDPALPFTDVSVPITPFIAGGISQVSVDNDDGESHGQSAFTWAVGVLVKNWDNLNIGLVYGEDYTGDKEWEHEGDGWFSFMIGWKL